MGRKHWVLKGTSDVAEKDPAKRNKKGKKSAGIKSRQIQMKNKS